MSTPAFGSDESRRCQPLRLEDLQTQFEAGNARSKPAAATISVVSSPNIQFQFRVFSGSLFLPRPRPASSLWRPPPLTPAFVARSLPALPAASSEAFRAASSGGLSP